MESAPQRLCYLFGSIVGKKEDENFTLVKGWLSESSWSIYRTTLLEAKNGLETVSPISWYSRDTCRDVYQKTRDHVSAG
jgi:hypothetical protein